MLETPGSCRAKVITDGVNQNVFSDLCSDKVTDGSGQDRFLADTTNDEAVAVKDTITDDSRGERPWTSTRCKTVLPAYDNKLDRER